MRTGVRMRQNKRQKKNLQSFWEVVLEKEGGLAGIRNNIQFLAIPKRSKQKRNITVKQHKEEPSNIPPQTLEFSQ